MPGILSWGPRREMRGNYDERKEDINKNEGDERT
jgi:hypothetical protein